MVFDSYLSENQFLAVDLGIVIPLAFFIPHTGPYKHLTKHHPTDALISFPVICSILIQAFIALHFQLGAYFLCDYFDNENFCEPDSIGEKLRACPINTSVFYVSNFQYLITAIAFSISKPFRSPFYTNYYLLFFMILAFVFSIYIIVYPKFPNYFLIDIFNLYYFDDPSMSFKRESLKDEDEIKFKSKNANPNMKYYIVAIIGANFLISYLIEKVFIPMSTRCWNENKKKKLKKRQIKEPENPLTMQQMIEIEELNVY